MTARLVARLAALKKIAAAHPGTAWQSYLGENCVYASGYDPGGVTKRYGAYGPWAESCRNARFVESTDWAGLRFVNFADEILSQLRHNGWYCDNYQDEVYRGAIWRLPARKGKSVFVHGYVDSCNKGAAFVCFDLTDDEEEAARWADSFAERHAEESREYYAKDSAQCRIGELKSEILDARASARGLIREIKAAAGKFSPLICDALRTQLRDIRRGTREAHNEIAKLEDNYWNAVPQF